MPTSSPPLVCILAAGSGSRMGALAENLHKALLPVEERAAITWIIESFAPATEFIVAIGHRASQLADYLSVAHPDRSIRLVEVDVPSGPGSGPGRSALAFEPWASRPFFLVCCDSLWSEPIPPIGDQDWIGVAPVKLADSAAYCNALIRDGQVIRLVDKQVAAPDQHEAFIGLAALARPALFFKGIRDAIASRDLKTEGEVQLAHGFQTLIDEGGLQAKRISSWRDIGTAARYAEVLKKDWGSFDFSKEYECFFRTQSKAVKYFSEKRMVSNRVIRAKILNGFIPSGLRTAGSFYSYEYVPGQTFYEAGHPALFGELLGWLDQSVWRKCVIPPGEVSLVAREFYFNKTNSRLKRFQSKNADLDSDATINGVRVPALSKQLNALSWESLFRAEPVLFHGDLHFDNIIVSDDGSGFRLIDWRQDFGGALQWGDIYYDLAKLLSGIRMDLHQIRTGSFQYSESGHTISYDFPRTTQREVYEEMLMTYATQHGLDPDRIQLLCSLIYLNMAALHRPPFDRLLIAHSRVELAAAMGL